MRHAIPHIGWIGLAALGLAWIGIWGPWIPHQASGLTQNALELAEWATFLSDVRYGDLSLAPEMLRMGVSCAAVALALGAGRLKRSWLRWGLRALALIPGLIMLPPYPYLLDLWWSDSYSLRFVAAAVGCVGVLTAALLARLSPRIRAGVMVVLSIAALALAGWAYLSLHPPFEAHYAAPIPPGWGLLAFLAGLALAVGTHTITMFSTSKPGTESP